MSVPARRQQSITVALPATLTIDIPHLREKTARIGQIGRSLSIFRVEHALIYLDQDTSPARREAHFIDRILTFQQTPQYLRRELFPVDPDLAFTGILPPLRTPNHPNRSRPEIGMIRDALVTTSAVVSEVNAGFQQPVEVAARLKIQTRITIRLTAIQPRPKGEIIDPARLPIYWGVQVNPTELPLGQVLKRSQHDLIISTSRKGANIREVAPSLKERWIGSKNTIIIFGSPSEGIPEILSRSKDSLPKDSFNINTMPDQGTETIRTEEAITGTLAVLNVLMGP